MAKKVFLTILVVLYCTSVLLAADWGTLFRSREHHFSIKFPTEWQVKSPGRGPHVVVVASAHTGESTNVLVKSGADFKKGMFQDWSQEDVNAFAETLTAQANQYMPVRLLDAKLVYISHQKAVCFVNEATYKKASGDFVLINTMYIVPQDGFYYQITTSAPPTTYQAYISTFLRIIDSFVDENGWY